MTVLPEGATQQAEDIERHRRALHQQLRTGRSSSKAWRAVTPHIERITHAARPELKLRRNGHYYGPIKDRKAVVKPAPPRDTMFRAECVNPITGQRDPDGNTLTMHDTYTRVGAVMGMDKKGSILNTSFAVAIGFGESGNNWEAIAGGGHLSNDPKDDRARGAMQVLPSTAAALANLYSKQLAQATEKLLGDSSITDPDQRKNLGHLQEILQRKEAGRGAVAMGEMRDLLLDRNIGVMFGMKYMQDMGIANLPMVTAKIGKGGHAHTESHVDLAKAAFYRQKYTLPAFDGDVAAIEAKYKNPNPRVFGPDGTKNSMADISGGLKSFADAGKIIAEMNPGAPDTGLADLRPAPAVKTLPKPGPGS